MYCWPDSFALQAWSRPPSRRLRRPLRPQRTAPTRPMVAAQVSTCRPLYFNALLLHVCPAGGAAPLACSLSDVLTAVHTQKGSCAMYR